MINHDKWIANYPEVWWQYAESDCAICCGTGEVGGTDEHTGSMCECVDWNKISEDGWEVD